MELSLYSVAQCLDIPESTVERWIRQGRIPIQKKHKKCIFNRFVLENWARKHHLDFALPGNESSEEEERLENLSPAMERGGVFYNIEGNDVITAFGSAVRLIPNLSGDEKTELYDRLLEREAMISTGIGNGVAVPHPRAPMEELSASHITTCFLKSPIDFFAVDNKDVFVMFILICPSVKTHLHLLSRLAFCVRDNSFITFLRTMPGPGELLSRIADFEKRLDNPGSSV